LKNILIPIPKNHILTNHSLSTLITLQAGTPNIYSGIFDFSLSLSQGDLLQLKVGKSAGSGTDSIITVVFTES
jgi:hypothetical protein